MNEEKNSKESPNDVIISLVDYINRDEKAAFYDKAEKYQQSLSQNGEVANRLSRTLYRKPKQLISLKELSHVVKRLIVQDETPVDCVFLNDHINGLIAELSIEWKNIDLFKYHNLGVRNKILLHGPTGNGKTTIARYIAKHANLPFVEVKSDLIIDSRIGGTGENIHAVFREVQLPCVLFWDEVDSIGRKRGKGMDDAASNENERMVNSILINLEKLDPKVIFIGATNRLDALDSAFVRRFDCKVEVPGPSREHKDAFSKQLIEYYKLPITDYNPQSFTNLSEIKFDLVDKTRKHILSQITSK